MGRRRPQADRVLGRIAPVSEATDVAGGQLLGQEIEDRPGQLTSGTIRHVECLGVRGFEIQCEANGEAEEVAGPPREGKAHEA